MESCDSSSSYSSSSPQETAKDCCRKIVAFMCTQVGVGGLIVAYAVLGAFGFLFIEQDYVDPNIKRMLELCNAQVASLYNVTKEFNTLNKRKWNRETDRILFEFQSQVVVAVKNGYNGKIESIWSFPSALMFSLSVFTMIGYGNIVPKTDLGKVATIIYAVFGIPLYILYFKNMGKVLAQVFRWAYTAIYRCSIQDTQEQRKRRIIVPSTACLWVLFAYVATGTIMFSSWQGWSLMDSIYFCVTSLCKIGVGDFSPDNIFAAGGVKTARLIITFIYLLFGMGVIAMCFDLMREDVTVRVKNLKNDVSLCFEDIQTRAIDFYRRRGSNDS